MATRTDVLEIALHRLANRVETELSDILCALLAESRIEAVHDLAYTATRLIETCRTVRDGKEGGEV